MASSSGRGSRHQILCPSHRQHKSDTQLLKSTLARECPAQILVVDWLLLLLLISLATTGRCTLVLPVVFVTDCARSVPFWPSFSLECQPRLDSARPGSRNPAVAARRFYTDPGARRLPYPRWVTSKGNQCRSCQGLPRRSLHVMESLRRSTLQGQHGDWHFEIAPNCALPRLSAATPAVHALETTHTERKRETPTNLIRSIAGLHSYATESSSRWMFETEILA